MINIQRKSVYILGVALMSFCAPYSVKVGAVPNHTLSADLLNGHGAFNAQVMPVPSDQEVLDFLVVQGIVPAGFSKENLSMEVKISRTYGSPTIIATNKITQEHIAALQIVNPNSPLNHIPYMNNDRQQLDMVEHFESIYKFFVPLKKREMLTSNGLYDVLYTEYVGKPCTPADFETNEKLANQAGNLLGKLNKTRAIQDDGSRSFSVIRDTESIQADLGLLQEFVSNSQEFRAKADSLIRILQDQLTGKQQEFPVLKTLLSADSVTQDLRSKLDEEKREWPEDLNALDPLESQGRRDIAQRLLNDVYFKDVITFHKATLWLKLLALSVEFNASFESFVNWIKGEGEWAEERTFLEKADLLRSSDLRMGPVHGDTWPGNIVQTKNDLYFIDPKHAKTRGHLWTDAWRFLFKKTANAFWSGYDNEARTNDAEKLSIVFGPETILASFYLRQLGGTLQLLQTPENPEEIIGNFVASQSAVMPYGLFAKFGGGFPKGMYDQNSDLMDPTITPQLAVEELASKRNGRLEAEKIVFGQH